LKKLQEDTTVIDTASKATAHLWIEEPLDKEPGHAGARINRLFATHPPLEERIKALEAM
jgi:heat shock protein HtpX